MWNNDRLLINKYYAPSVGVTWLITLGGGEARVKIDHGY